MAVVDWIENKLIPSFFNPSQPCWGGATNSLWILSRSFFIYKFNAYYYL